MPVLRSSCAILRLSLALAAALVLAAGPAFAQAGATTDVLTGTIRTEDGRPVVEAIVTATSLETQISRTSRTDARGRYVIVFPDGGGQYRLLVRAIGMAPQILSVVRQADEDRLVTDVTVSPTATRLADINVQARRAPLPGGQDAPGPGATERVLNIDQLQRLPIDASDLSLLATLAPGVVLTEGTDSTLGGFSVAGQRPDANAVTLDGLLFGGAQLPPEAMRNARVITNAYDVSRGQFSGGLVSSTTRGGSNMVQGGLTYGLRDQNLELDEDETTGSFGQGYTQHQLSLGLGGPLIRDRLFFFGSGQIRTRDDALATLTTATPATLERLGVAPDSVARFGTLVGAAGLSPSLDVIGPDRDTDALTLVGRADWIASQSHTVMLRGDWRGNWQEPSRLGALALPQTAAVNRSRGGGVMASLSSRFGVSFVNELRAYGALSTREAETDLLLPQGRVQVTSVLESGEQSTTSLSFGGNGGVPQYARNRSLEISDELSWLAGQHRVKLGGLLVRSESEQEQSTNRYGTFSYLSLADFEANQPSSFTRTLTPGRFESSTRNDAVYLSDTWRAGGGLQLTYGVRAEFGRLGGAPAYNPEVDQLFGRRTDAFPRETQLSPRFGFTWMVGGGPGRGGQGGPGGFAFSPLILRGGIGLFRSPLPGNLAGLAAAANGLAGGEGTLFCTGASTPVPDWSAYLADPAAIPSDCVGGPSPVPARAPNVTVFSPGFRAPQSVRASLGGQRRLGSLGTVNLDVTWARGRHQTGSIDLNLAAAPAFVLAGEAGRPVYAPAATITPATGAVSLLASRRFPQYGQVLSLQDDYATSSIQATVSAQGVTRGGTVYNLSYTLARSRDQSSGGSGLGSATTAGNPNVRDWSASDFDRRHSILATVTHPFNQGLELTAIGRMTSGAPYTPRVGGDINADGSRNDRAFIYDPALAPDTALANGMTRLLASTSGGARSCLESQLGRIAGRNSCRSPWVPTLDLQLNWRPNMLGFDRRLAVSIVTVNLLGGVDRLLHGSDGLKGWGQTIRPDATLLYVNGFDGASERFLYTVNERFGATGAGANAFRVPFQIGIQARYTIGPDRFRDAIRGLIGNRGGGGRGPVPAGGGNLPGGGAAPGGPFARLERTLPNPARQVLNIADSVALGLTPAQRETLGRAADSLDAEAKSLADAVRKDLAGAGANPDMAALMARMRPRLDEARERIQKAVDATQAVLTPEQWAKLPESIRLMAERMRGFGPGGLRQQRRPPE